jgi:hypothetical protein
MSHQNYSLTTITANVPAVITNDRIFLPLHGRLYPFFTEDAELPETLKEFPKNIYAYLGFDAVRCDQASLFKGYAACIDRLDEMRQQFNTLCDRVCKAGGFIEPCRMREFATATPPMAELAIIPLKELKESMSKELKQACVRFTVEMVATLDAMVSEQHCGVIDWMCPDACRYHYFIFKDEVTALSTKRDETVEGKRHTVTTTTDKERVRSITRHVHDLVTAKRRPIPDLHSKLRTDPSWGKVILGQTIPGTVRRVIQAVPTWLGAEYVDGQQIRDLRIEREISREEWTDIETTTWEERPPVIQQSSMFRYDPAVIVGHYCLIGWNEISVNDSRCRTCAGSGCVPGYSHNYCPDGTMHPCPFCDGFGTV